MELPNPPDPASPIRHRAPILCVDRIVEASEDHAVCELDVREGAQVVDGSLWEPGLVEGLAQSSAVLQSCAAPDGQRLEGVGMLVGVRRFAVRRRPTVGEQDTWRVDIVKRLGPYLLVEGVARCGEEVLASGELKFYWDTGSAGEEEA